MDTNKKRAPRNRTLTVSDAEIANYSKRILDFSKKKHRKGENRLFTLDEITDKTIMGDSFEVLDSLPKESFDLLIADPPYNLTKSYNGNIFSKKSIAEYESFTRDWLEKVKPLMKPGASVYICCDWESSLIIGHVLSEFLEIRNRISWQREKGRGSKNNWKNGMEDIWYAVNPGADFTFNVDCVKQKRRVLAPYKENGEPKSWEETADGRFRETFPSNFWDDITIPFWSMPENTDHPTQKPEKLIAKLVLASSNPSDLVLDPFSGSGTTGVVSKKLGRHYAMIEQEKLYACFGEKRLELAENDKSIQGYEDGIFWERNSLYNKR